LYLVLFDADIASDFALYESFRTVFLTGYVDGSGRPDDTSAVDELI